MKVKPAKSAPSNGVRRVSKAVSKKTARGDVKLTAVESRRNATTAKTTSASRPGTQERQRPKEYANAIHAYETGIRLMHAEEFEKAIKCFQNLIAEHPEEPEIQGRAKILIQASEKKIQEKARTILRSADDHYNVGIADLNRRELTSAVEHLQHALKLMPKGDHILYALATASALQGDRERALGYLKNSIQYRGENRFLALRDSDFQSLSEDPDFKQLVQPAEK
jgi:tetratricopeptide (TPR) repeat protein